MKDQNKPKSFRSKFERAKAHDVVAETSQAPFPLLMQAHVSPCTRKIITASTFKYSKIEKQLSICIVQAF